MRSGAGWPSKPQGYDVAIVGGGVIGSSIAYHLAQRGARVVLLERSHLAAGASGAAAGLLAPQVEATVPDAFFVLTIRGRAEHGPLSQQLLADVGIDGEYRQCGILRIANTEAERVELQRQQRWQTSLGYQAEWLEPEQLGECEPLLRGVAGRLLAGGLWLGDEAQVRSPRLVKALALAAVKHGAEIREGTAALGLSISGGRVVGVRTSSGDVAADTVVLAAGVWSPEVGRLAGLDLPIVAVKGQVLSLRTVGTPLRQVVWRDHCYLVPKLDGEVVVGATEEEGNYDARPTLAGIGTLSSAAIALVPRISRFAMEQAWAGLRPAAPDRFPLVGWAPALQGLLVATAHFRNGVLLGPLTGRLVADAILANGDFGPLAPFHLGRFQPVTADVAGPIHSGTLTPADRP